MKFTVQMIAGLIGGEVEGDGNRQIDKVAKIDDTAPEGSICFLANPKYENFIYQTTASAVIVGKDFQPKNPVQASLIRVEDPYSAFTRLLEEYQKIIHQQQLTRLNGVEEPAHIGEGVQMGKEVYVGAFSYIGRQCTLGDQVKIYPQSYIGSGVTIGANTVIHPGVKIYADTEIGANCEIHAGAVVGSEGFGFAPQADGTFKNIPQLGKVILEDLVTVGANTTIDRATLGATLIRQGVKLDNLIQIGHNVVVGKNTVIAAQAGISGSAKLGDNCMLAGQVGVAGHLEIANKVQIGGQAGVNANVTKEGDIILGSPAYYYRDFFKSAAIFRKLPDLQKRIKELEEKLLTLQSSLQSTQDEA